MVCIVPIEPRSTGNGLAMRAGALCRAAEIFYDVKVIVLPVSGTPSPVGRIENLSTFLVPVADLPQRDITQRDEFLADRIVRSLSLDQGSPVFALRSYLAGVALGVASRLDARWIGLDLDDDDESFAAAVGNSQGARRIRDALSKSLPAFDVVTVSSPDDAGALSQRYRRKIETLVNTVAIPPEPSVRREPERSVIFVGNLTYSPNINAVLRLVNEVLPEIRRTQLGERSKALIAGPYDPKGPLRTLLDRDDVALLGFVADLEPLYRRAGVVVLPLESGSGTRIKVLEAFAHKVPVVSTQFGVAGIDVTDGEHLLIRESPVEIARSVSELFGDAERCKALTSEAYALVAERYSMRALHPEFSRICVEIESMVEARA